uniref:Peptidase S1 domain-containing protein n=1 Tax=Glossina palpalis gambiensis TaxID=67801 RepID=A0A1B0AZC6_9MUSC
MLINFYIVHVFGIVILIKQISTESCINDRSLFESESKMAKHFVKIDCEQGGRQRIQFGIIYSENIILTSNEYKVGDSVTCFIKYKNLRGPTRPGRYKNMNTIVEVWRMDSYIAEKDILSRTSVSLKILLLRRKMKLDTKLAAPMPLPERPYKQQGTCVVIGGDKPDTQTKIVEMKAVVIDRKECESTYPNLGENVLCVEIPDKFCNFEHCDEYIEGSALVCDGVLTALIGPNQPCFPLKPRTSAGVYEATKWIRSLEKLISSDREYKKALVTVVLSAAKKNIYDIGIILSKNKILTAYAPNLHETRIFEQGSFSDFYEAKGHIEYGAGKTINWNKARSHTNTTIFAPRELQLSVIMLNEDIHLSPQTAYSMRLPETAPRRNAKCIIATLFPRWMKFSLTLMDYDECVKRLPQLHKDYMCIRQILPHTDDCIQSGNPIICDGELTAIVAKMTNCNKNYPRPVTPIHRYRSWILATMRGLELSGSEQSTFAWLLWLINSFINLNVFLQNN